MSRRKFKIIILSVVGFIVICVGSLTFWQIAQKEKTKEVIVNLPNFIVWNLENQHITPNYFEQDKGLVVIFFNSTCSYCIYELKEIKKNIEAFSKVEILMISEEGRTTVKENWVDLFELEKYSNITVTYDSTSKVHNTFGVSRIPSIYVYDENKVLTKHWGGETSAEALLKSIN